MRLHDYLDYQARERPQADFAVHGMRRLTYGEALTEVNRLAHALASSGLEIGDRIAILAKNSIEYVVLYYGASKAGVVPVPLNYRLAPVEWRYIINDAQAKVLLAANEYRPAVDACRADLATVERFVVLDGARTKGWDDYPSWLVGHPATALDRLIMEDHSLYQMYTSGTTGHPKGAVLTHHAVTSQMEQLGLTLRGEPGERRLLVAPVFHAAAANVTVFQSVYWGSCLYIQAEFQPAEVVRALSEEQIGVAQMVPAMIQACLVAVPDAAQRQYEALRLIAYGASPIAEQTLRRAMEVFQCEFIQGYGMTETTCALTNLLPSDHRRAVRDQPALLRSAGRPLLGTEVRIVDAQDNPVPSGTIGEIVGRGPQLMAGYWHQPESSTETMRGGWLHTGDAGMLDEDGYVYIQNRVKDMIVSGGENVYPRTVEAVLFAHPAVADVAVIGVPDPHWGETVKAVVVLCPGVEATADELIEFCCGKLGGFERPRSVDFLAALPRNPSGKVLKRLLREPYWAGHDHHIAGA